MTESTDWLNAEESAAWVRLVAVAELLPTALDAQLGADVGLTHFEYVALMVLASAPERTAPAAVSGHPGGFPFPDQKTTR